jgi:DNA-binding beta-propeller fold protein YncE
MHNDGRRYDTEPIPIRKHALREKKEEKSEHLHEHRVPRWVYRVIAILAVAALAVLAWFNRTNLAPENVLQWARTSIVGMGVGDGYPKAISGSNVGAKNFSCSGTNIVYASDTALSVCNTTGKELLSTQHSYANPLMRVEGIRILLCSLGGKNAEMFTTGGNTVSLETDQNILGAALTAKGRSALITAADGYCGKLTAYDATGKVLSYYWFADYYPTAVALSPDGTKAAVTGVSSQDGEIVSAIYVIPLDSDKTVKPQAVCKGNFLSGVFWDTEGTVAAVGDTSAVILKPDTSEKKEYSYNGEQLTAFCSNDGRLALGLMPYGGSQDNRLVVLDSSGSETYTTKFTERILSVSLTGNTASALTKGKLYFCSLSSSDAPSDSDAGSDARAVALKDENTAYVLGISEVRLVSRK